MLKRKTTRTKMAEQLKNRTVHMKRILIVFVAVVLVTSILSSPIFNQKDTSALSVTELRNQSANLQKEIDANRAQAEALSAQADSLKVAISGLDIDISNATKQIELTIIKIAELQVELEKAQAEEQRQKDLLKASIRALYKTGGASTIELLVGSDSFSEFINGQEYLERIKIGIQDSTKRVIELRQQIQIQKTQQDEQKAQQEAAKRDLDNAKVNRAALLAKTQGEEAQYRQVVSSLKAKQAEAEAALARALNTGSYRVSPVGPIGEGEVVGAVGSTGLSSGPHLHLEVRNNNGVINPEPYIKTKPINMPPGYVSQRYGNPDPIYTSGYHPGIDYAISSGSAIYAIDNGYMYRGCSNQMLGTSNNAYGYVAIVEHSNGTKSVYAHMSGGPASCNYNTYY